MLEMRDAPACDDRADDGSLNLKHFSRMCANESASCRMGVWLSEVPFTEAQHLGLNKPPLCGHPRGGSVPVRAQPVLCCRTLVLYDDIHAPIPGLSQSRTRMWTTSGPSRSWSNGRCRS
jgi:hypothetical protein